MRYQGLPLGIWRHSSVTEQTTCWEVCLRREGVLEVSLLCSFGFQALPAALACQPSGEEWTVPSEKGKNKPNPRHKPQDV